MSWGMGLTRAWLAIAIACCTFGNSLLAQDALQAGFERPPASAKARTWWHWINGNVSKHGITADLESMKQVGIQEAQLFNVGLGDPRGASTYLSPQWLEMLEFSALEAKRLGLELGFHNGPGWSSSGGPWVTPEHAMQTVVFSETFHLGGGVFKQQLPQPEYRFDYYRDIAVLAFPKPKTDQRIDDLDFKALSGRVRHRLAPDAKPVPASAVIDRLDIVDLTDQVTGDGMLDWNAPDGDWVILRLGHTPNGHRNRPAPFGGSGLECDKMSRNAVDAYWKGGIEPVIGKLGDLVGSVVTNCVIDSYEVGTTNWTIGFDQQFQRLRDYECTAFLPTLAGFYVDSGESTERFLWDFRRTIGDLIAENYYGHFRQRCHQHGLKLSVEPYWGPFDSMQVGAAGDIVMCEFWSGEVAFFDTPKFVSSIAKLSGDSIVGAEAFTGLGGWTEHPATIKSIGDRAWAQGINRFIFHSYVHQPWDVGPGLTLSYHGLELNRLNTWWKQGTAFLEYVGRGQFLLQQGQSVADVLVFVGESSPNNAFLMPEIKAMGFDYDLIGTNKLDSLTVSDGLIRTATGATYRVLVLPETTWMTPETMQKLKSLTDAGAKILGRKPTKSPSLRAYPECDQHVAQTAEALWGSGAIKDSSIIDFLNAADVPAAFDVDGGPREQLDFIHREVDGADIFFVASSGKEKRHERCRFRVTGKQPEIWDAQTGEIQNAAVWQDNGDGTTSVPIQFAAEGSAFVVFRKLVATSDHIVETTMQLQQPKPSPLPNLKIIKAEYGTFLADGLLDVTQALTDRVKENQLDVIAGRQVFGFDPAPGYKKELRVSYMVGDSAHHAHVREREFVRLDAAGKGDLKIVNAVFGKFAEQTNGVPPKTRARNVTSNIESMVAAGVLEIPVNDELSGDQPNDGKEKELRISYSTGGQLQKRSIRHGRTLSLATDIPQPALVIEGGKANWLTPYAGNLNYRTSSEQTQTVEVKTVPDSIPLSGRWGVNFPGTSATQTDATPTDSASTDATFDQLISWSSSADKRIKYFSGTATYKKQFQLPDTLLSPNTSLELDLGNVSVIAEVMVNGQNAGVLWKAPFRVNLDGLVNEGTNQLEIKVTNLWANRLIGDEQLPNDIKRKGRSVKQWPDWLLNQSARTSGRVSFSAYRHFDKDSKLQPSGLLGPVIIRPYVRARIAR